MTKFIGKATIWRIFGFLVSASDYTNYVYGSLCSWCGNLMDNDTSSEIFLVMLIIWFYLKKLLKIKILSHLPRYYNCLFAVQKLYTLISGNKMGNCMPKKWFRMTNCEIAHLSAHFRQSVTKIMGKAAIWIISCFYPLPHPNMLRNNE